LVAPLLRARTPTDAEDEDSRRPTDRHDHRWSHLVRARMDREFQHCSLALYRLAGAIVDDQVCSILTSSSWIKTGNGIQLTLRVDFMVYS
jgi:hypothetical protein